MRLRPLALAGLALSAGLAHAAPDQFDYKLANILILQNRKIQNEMGITQAQRDRMNAYAKVQRDATERVKAEAQKAGQTGFNADQQKRIQQGFLTLRAGVLSLLNPAQLKRLREITLQSAGTAALLDPTVDQRLKVTAAQRTTMAKAFGAGQQKAAGLQKSTFSPVMAKYQKLKPKSAAEGQQLQTRFNAEMKVAANRITPQMKGIEKATSDRMLAALSSGQRSAFQALKGRPVKS